MKNLIISLLVISIFSCQTETPSAKIEQYKVEVVNAEKAFAQLAKEKGMEKAFVAFAAEDAVLSRNNALIRGKEEISQYFGKESLREVSLEWEPDFVDVAASGDLAYTYGKFQFSAIDTSGNPLKAEGIFHTVWKRQDDGQWKYVWD